MLTTETRDLLKKVRRGGLDANDEVFLESLSAREFITDLRGIRPVLFQERVIGRKVEVGLARAVRPSFAVHASPGSAFRLVYLAPVLTRCLFVSAYDDRIGEITFITTIHMRLARAKSNEFVIRMGRGRKLDKAPDGWRTRRLPPCRHTFAEALLIDRGWKFDALVPVRPAAGP